MGTSPAPKRRVRGALKAYAGGPKPLQEAMQPLADMDAAAGKGMFPDVGKRKRAVNKELSDLIVADPVLVAAPES